MNVKRKKAWASPAVRAAGIVVLCLLIPLFTRDFVSGRESGQDLKQRAALKEEFADRVAYEIGNALYHQFIPVFSFVRQGEEDTFWILQKQVNSLLPFYRYANAALEEQNALVPQELSLEEILLAEADEGSAEYGGMRAESGETGTETEKEGNGEEGTGEAGKEEGNIGPVQGPSLEDLMQAENQAAWQTENSLQTETENGLQAETASGLQAPERETEGSLPVDNAAGVLSDFIPHTLQNPISVESLQNYENLIKDFYIVDKNTMVGSDQINAEKLLGRDMRISKEGEGPQILIFHTHSQEAFADSVPGERSTSIVGVGDWLTQILEEEYGYRVLHHDGEYDVEARDDAYSAALPAIEQILSENPSVEVVIDLHRDQMAEETRLVMDLDGRPTARFMFFNGLSRTRKTGNISYLYNENQEDNLAFSFQMQKTAMEYYPGLTRKIYLKGYRYNMHLRPKYLLVEMGAQNNTVEEVRNACEPLAHILNLVLTGAENG